MKNYFNSISNKSELERSQKTQSFIKLKTNFGYSEIEDIMKDLYEEIDELKEEIKKENNTEKIKNELGDVIFVLCNLANKFSINTEEAIKSSIDEYQRRWLYIENQVGTENIEKINSETIKKLWKEAKKLKK